MSASRAPAAPWVVLAAATATSTLTGPGQTIGVSVFIDHLVADLGLTRSQVSTAYLIGTLTGAALLPRVGRAVDRHGVRLAQIIIGVAFGVALVNMSFVSGIAWLAVGFTGIRFLGQGSLSLVSTVTVSVRFARNRGTALGIFATVSGGGMALVPLVLNLSIDSIGWRQTWLVAAAVVAVTVVALAVFALGGLRSGSVPADQQLPENDPSEATGGATRTIRPAYDRAAAIRTLPFWALAAASGTAGMLSTGLVFHQIDLLGDAGLSSTAAAALFVPQVIGSTIAGLGAGYLSDRAGLRALPAVAMTLLLLAHWLAAVVAPGITVLVYAVVLGAMGGAIRTTVSAALPMWFGTAHLGSIQGSLTFFNVGASALGPVALAVARDQFGSYPPAVLALSVLPAAVLVLVALPMATRPPAPIPAPRH
ncbi:MAG: MFS transporter [Actinomycetota bacterium]